jgi:hypothetical protein
VSIPCGTLCNNIWTIIMRSTHEKVGHTVARCSNVTNVARHDAVGGAYGSKVVC